MSPADRPDDETLDDDHELDKWFDGFVKSAARRAGGGGAGSSKYDLNKTAWGGADLYGAPPGAEGPRINGP